MKFLENCVNLLLWPFTRVFQGLVGLEIALYYEIRVFVFATEFDELFL